MKVPKIFTSLILCSMTLILVSCSAPTDELTLVNKELKTLNQKIAENTELINTYKAEQDTLKSNNQTLTDEIQNLTLLQKRLLQTIEVADTFANAFINGEVTVLSHHVSDQLTVNQKGIYDGNNDQTISFVKDQHLQYQVNSFAIEDSKIFYQYIVFDSNTTSEGFFLNFYLKTSDGTNWVVDSLSLDI